MGLDLKQFREHVVRPTLLFLAPDIPYSVAAERLLLGTAWHESGGLKYLDQLAPGVGPGLGLYQMEAATHLDIWYSYLEYRKTLAEKVKQLRAGWPAPLEQLQTNLAYATAMARVHYWRQPETLPGEHDLAGLARYAKTHFNTSAGKATADDYHRALLVVV